MKVQPFVLVNKSQSVAFNASFSSDAAAWAEDWFFEPPSIEVTSVPVSRTFDQHRSSKGIRFVAPSEGLWAVCSICDGSWSRLGSMLLADQEASAGDLSSGSILYGLVQSALFDLTRRILPLPDGAFGSEQDTLEALLPDEAFNRGNEAMHLSIDIQGIVLSLWVPISPLMPRISKALPKSTSNIGRLIKPREAIGHRKLPFEIYLGSAELTLGAISELKTGDVIHLDKDLRDPLRLVFDKSSVRFSGFLGKLNDHFAFRIDSLQE